MSDISNEVIRAEMELLVKKVDLETVTTKQFMKLLSKKLNVQDLSKKKKFIKDTITEILDAMESQESEDDASESEEDVKPKKKQKSTKKKPKSTPTKKTKKDPSKAANPNNPFNTPKKLSPLLSTFLGAPEMSRPQVVKSLWDYIKSHDLQNPSNKREILLDDRMRDVFGVDNFSMFKMAKYVSAHIEPFKPVVESDDESEGAKETKKRKREEKKKKAKEKRSGGSGGKRKNNMPAHRLSEDLAEVVGLEVCTRPRVMKKLWEYIKANNLQNDSDKREIICDEAFKRVMAGNEKVTMFTMSKFLSPHFLEKVDKSEYFDSDAEQEEEE